MADVTMIDAITMAMAWELEHDDRVIVLGEDVGVNGGVFRATAGLQQRFGAERVQDTPLAEGLIAGVSIGLAAQRRSRPAWRGWPGCRSRICRW
jgi:pyruvate dehydrogenase E1 component beta subunit